MIFNEEVKQNKVRGHSAKSQTCEAAAGRKLKLDWS